jgi:hypothetical protein
MVDATTACAESVENFLSESLELLRTNKNSLEVQKQNKIKREKQKEEIL